MQQRAVAPRLCRVEAELVVEIVEADRLEIVDAADGDAAADGALAHDQRGQMRAGRPARGEEPLGIGAPVFEMGAEPGCGGARLGGDRIHARRRRQRVARDGDVDALGQRRLGDEGEAVLRVVLPIAAMEEQQRRRAVMAGREEIEPRPGPRRIGNLARARDARAQRRAAALPVGDDGGAAGHRGRVVVGGVERRTVHAAIECHDAAVPCRLPLRQVPSFSPAPAAPRAAP